MTPTLPYIRSLTVAWMCFSVYAASASILVLATMWWIVSGLVLHLEYNVWVNNFGNIVFLYKVQM